MHKTLFDKVWYAHLIRDLGDEWALVHIDRHLLHDLSGPLALEELERRGLSVRNPELSVATPDHAISSEPGRTGMTLEKGGRLWRALKERTRTSGVRFFELGTPGHGIVHVMAPELGLVLPGTTLVCGDSHTCTNGGLGALAFGIGTSDVAHVLATQTLRLRKPKSMRVRFEGRLGRCVSSKDLMLDLIARFGTSAGTGCAIEYGGSTIEAMDVEARLTLCNLSIELGANMAMIAPDETTFSWLQGRPFAPSGSQFDRAVAYWQGLNSDPDAIFDREEYVDASEVPPTITWGTSPEHAIGVDGIIPHPREVHGSPAGKALEAALSYMGLEPGRPIAGTKVDYVFIGSCANSRLSDLRVAAGLVRGRRVAGGVRAWVVAGSENVKRDAEAEGLDRIFTEAGFEWREPSCSMCSAVNGERVPPRARSISTSNRNFVGRQGPEARTHIASPATAAAAAVTGFITDPRAL